MFSDSNNDSPDNITDDIPNEFDDILREIEADEANSKRITLTYYPVIPLREQVIFPGSECSFYIGREDTLAALSYAIEHNDKMIFLANQKDSDQENPAIEDLYHIGVLAVILNVDTDREKNVCCVTVKAFKRAEIREARKTDRIQTVAVRSKIDYFSEDNEEMNILLNHIIKDFSKYCHIEHLAADIVQKISSINEMEELINALASNVRMPYLSQIKLLQETDTIKRLALLASTIRTNIDMTLLQKKIVMDIRKDNDKQQKEFFLHEQIKSLQKELLTLKDDPDSIIDDEDKFAEYIEKLGMNEQAKDKAISDAKKLRSLPTISPDAGILRNYIDWLIKLPWTNKSHEILDYKRSEAILNEEHYGLHKVKQRIMEFIAVRNLNQTIRGPILCFVGPPGIGKTSLSRSVAKALGREFIRISLGGVRDEAEIRGHRRTYLGAMPGKIIQSMRKVKSVNPVFLLDEIDKMTSDMRGDPASALLEVLDPEQNAQFMDHYLDVPYDLSEVMFITTANSLQGIPYPLRDRMEIISLESYTETEKVHIAQKFLINREKKENGIENVNLKIDNDAILSVIRHWTMEAGVRSLQRQIATICRKTAKNIVLGKLNPDEEIHITKTMLTKYLGKKKFIRHADKVLDVGVSHGLAWSELGGSLLPIECVIYRGSGKLVLTGKLGDVMKESAQTAYSYIRSRAHLFDIKYKDFHKIYDVHIHFPEGATPKDGPSGGVAISCAILSALTKTPMNSDVAMTGEITLTGKVIPIGGLKEKVLAAARHKKKIVIIPAENHKDLDDIPKSTAEKIDFREVRRASEVFKMVFPQSVYKTL